MSKASYIIIFILLYPYFLCSQNTKMTELFVFQKIQSKEFQQAIDSLDKLILKNPKSEYSLTKLDLLVKTKRYEEALQLASHLNRSVNGIASEIEIKIYFDLDDTDNIKKALIKNLKSRYKISLFDLLNNPEYNRLAGSEFLDSILQSNLYSKTEKQLYQVEKMYENERYDQAMFLVNEIISRNNQIADAYYLKSLINIKLDDNSRALESINTVIALKASDPDFYYQRAKLLKTEGKYNQALLDVNKLILLQSLRFDNYLLKTELLMLIGDFSEAVQLCSQLLEIQSENTDLLFIKGNSYFKLGNNLEALKAVNTLMQIKTSKVSYELRGDIYMKTNTYEYAIRDYSMCLDMDPYNGAMYAKKGLARQKMGDNRGACSDWEKGKRYGNYNSIRYIEKYCK